MKNVVALIIAAVVLVGVMYFSYSSISKRVDVDFSNVSTITIQRSRTADVADELDLSVEDAEQVLEYLNDVKFYSEDVLNKGEPSGTKYPRYRIKLNLEDGGLRVLYVQPDYYIVGSDYKNVWADADDNLEVFLENQFE